MFAWSYGGVTQEIEKMFCKKEGPPMIVRQYLGLFGKAGLGKTTICCEAMFQYMQGKHRGRYCRVKLTESDKAADGKGADERSADGKKRQERIKLAIQQLVGLPKDLSKVMSEREVRLPPVVYFLL